MYSEKLDVPKGDSSTNPLTSGGSCHSSCRGGAHRKHRGGVPAIPFIEVRDKMGHAENTTVATAGVQRNHREKLGLGSPR